MTATGVQFRDFAVAKQGYRYDVGPTRTTGVHGYFDCSGLVTYAAHSCGLSIPTVSALQARYCHDHGTDRIPIDQALREAGVLMFKGDNLGQDGWGSVGHVAISMGDGKNVIEAKGHAWGVLVDPASNGSHPWTNAARLPGLLYSGKTTPATPPKETDMAWMICHHPKSTPDRPSYWEIDPAGHVFAYPADGSGPARYHGGQGSTLPGGGKVQLNGTCDDFTPTPSGDGYLLVSSVGSIYAFGDARKLGDAYGDPRT